MCLPTSNCAWRTFDDAVLESVRNSSGVDEAEARRVFSIRVRAPGTSKWTAVDMVAFDDFENNKVNLLMPLEGKSIPGKREVILERDTLNKVDVEVGGMLELQLPDGSIKTMPVVGIVQDTAMGAGDFLASPFAYITQNTLRYLQEPQDYNRIYATVAEGGDDIEHIRVLGADLKDESRKGQCVRHPLALMQRRTCIRWRRLSMPSSAS